MCRWCDSFDVFRAEALLQVPLSNFCPKLLGRLESVGVINKAEREDALTSSLPKHKNK